MNLKVQKCLGLVSAWVAVIGFAQNADFSQYPFINPSYYQLGKEYGFSGITWSEENKSYKIYMVKNVAVQKQGITNNNASGDLIQRMDDLSALPSKFYKSITGNKSQIQVQAAQNGIALDYSNYTYNQLADWGILAVKTINSINKNALTHFGINENEINIGIDKKLSNIIPEITTQLKNQGIPKAVFKIEATTPSILTGGSSSSIVNAQNKQRPVFTGLQIVSGGNVITGSMGCSYGVTAKMDFQSKAMGFLTAGHCAEGSNVHQPELGNKIGDLYPGSRYPSYCKQSNGNLCMQDIAFYSLNGASPNIGALPDFIDTASTRYYGTHTLYDSKKLLYFSRLAKESDFVRGTVVESYGRSTGRVTGKLTSTTASQAIDDANPSFKFNCLWADVSDTKNIDFGDSGGGVFLNVNGERLWAGIVSLKRSSGFCFATSPKILQALPGLHIGVAGGHFQRYW